MAKAAFHKSQRVYVKPVGTWAVIEEVLPQWVKGLDEPLKVLYDVGLGREFSASELTADKAKGPTDDLANLDAWRIMRAPNRWKTAEEAESHPYPGTHPIIVTDEKDWGGWRVPNAEYDRDPEKIEFQARIICTAPHLMRMAKTLVDIVSRNPHDV
ncbi:MAG: hypothetical protein AAGB25_02045, partial [Pseudomonadota bacterium]